jgi:hypothetical protein
VAFIDLLGVSSRLSDPSRAAVYAETLARVLDSLAGRHDEGFYEVENLHSGAVVEIEHYRPDVRGAKITTVSDAIVISLPISSSLSIAGRAKRVYKLLDQAYTVQRSLLLAGFRSRGAVCIGGLIHTSRFIVGEALVRAYRLESNEAIVPRVVIERDVVQALLDAPDGPGVAYRNRVAHRIRQDADGWYFIDYLAWDPGLGDYGFRVEYGEMFSAVLDDLRTTTDARVREKLLWMKAQFILGAQSRRLYKEPITDHAEPAFSDRFFRDNDNCVEWLMNASADIPAGNTTGAPARIG